MAPMARGNPVMDASGFRPAAVGARRAARWPAPTFVWLSAVLVAFGLALFAAGCGGGSPAASASARPNASAATVARVDGDAVTRGEVERAIAFSSLSAKPLTFKQALEAEIRNQLLRREAARLHVTVGDGAVAARLVEVEASLGGAAALQASLSAAGLSLSDYRQELRDALLAEALGARKFPAATPSNAQVLAFYRAHRDELTTPPAVRLAEILVKTQSLGRAVIDRLRLGYSFAEVARAYSMDPDSVAPGGVLGWVTTSSLPAPLARALAKAPRGTIVGPVQAIGGWHVLKVLGRRAAYTQPVAAARPAIVAQLTTQRQAALLSAWLVRARGAAHVTTGS